MKKIFVGILGIFIALGGLLLSACGGSNVSIKLYGDSYQEIVVLDDDKDNSISFEAEVIGSDSKEVVVNSSQEDIVSVKAVYNSVISRNIITLTAGEVEGTATVSIKSKEGSVTENVTVYVHGEVTQMSKNTNKDINGKRNDFAVRGETITLDKDKLISFTKTLNTKRTDVVWDYADDTDRNNVIIDNGTIEIKDTYLQNKVTVRAYSKFNNQVFTDIELDVIDKIDTSSLSMEYVYGNGTSGFASLEEGSEIELVSNTIIPNKKLSTIALSFPTENLFDIKPVVKTLDGFATEQISILSNGIQIGNTKYFVAQGKDDADLTVNANFEISYKEYNYNVSSYSFKVSSYRRVEKLKVESQFGELGEDKVQSLYSFYENGLGEKFDVKVLPAGVIKAEGKYRLHIEYPHVLGQEIKFDENTIQIQYKKKGDYKFSTLRFTQPNLEQPIFVATEDIDATEIYIKTNWSQLNPLSNVKLVFNSCDNEEVSTTGLFNLYQSVSALEIDKDEAKINLASNNANSGTKEFIVKGQQSLEGLYINSTSNNVEFSALRIVDVVEGGIKVAFDYTLKREAIGITKLDTYKVCHKNGVTSKEFEINIFLPLTEGNVNYDASTENNAVTKRSETGKMYDNLLQMVSLSQNGLSDLMIKKGYNIFLKLSTNKDNAQKNQAQADIAVRYLDFDGYNSDGSVNETLLQAFKNRSIASIVADAKDISGILQFTQTEKPRLVTNSQGYSIVLVSFTGLDENAEEVTFYRYFLVESYIAPSEWTISSRQVEVYANNSVSEEHKSECRKNIKITFGSEAITYRDLKYFRFILGGEELTPDNLEQVTFADKSFAIEHIDIQPTYMTFDIVGQDTKGASFLSKDLTIAYQYDENHKYLYLANTLNIKIINADRIENVVWSNENKDGIYFELSDEGVADEPKVLIFSTTPTNAKNNKLRYYLTNNLGIENDYLSFTQLESNGLVQLKAKAGNSGYLYVLPEDAIYDGEIKYYVGGNNDEQSLALSQLGIIVENGKTGYDILMDNAYFVNNSQKNVYLKDLIVKIKVTVANGANFDQAYRIYNANQFNAIQKDKYYVVMNNIALNETYVKLNEFNGGIMGYNENVTVILDNNNFASINNGTIKDISFAGNVNSEGFIVDTNNGRLSNVTIDVNVKNNSYSCSVLTGNGAVGTNNGEIENLRVLGLQINNGIDVGGLAGINNGTIKSSRVEFYSFEGGTNTFTSSGNVGALVGLANLGSRIENSFAYNYALQNDNTSKVLFGSKIGAIVGAIVSEDAVRTGNVTINKSFAVVNEENPIGNGTGTINSSYTAYYQDNEYKVNYLNKKDSDFLFPSDDGFKVYVNGKDNAHLKDVYQDEAVLNIDAYALQELSEKFDNGKSELYKSLSLGDDAAIIFYFDVQTNTTLSSSEKIELDRFNTINVSDLFKNNNVGSEKIVVLSDNASVISVNGNQLKVNGIGEVTLSVYSKHDFSKNRTISVKVLNTISSLKAYRTFAGTTIEIGENYPLQRGKDSVIEYGYSKSRITLGNQANTFNFVENRDLTVSYSTNLSSQVGEKVEYQTSGNNTVIISAGQNSVNTKLSAVPYLTSSGLDELNQKLKEMFAKEISIEPFDGTIKIVGSADKVSMTPSTSGYLKAVMTSSKSDDRLLPEITFEGTKLQANESTNLNSDAESGSQTYTYSYNQSKRISVQADWKRTFDEKTNLYNFEYDFVFSVAQEYKTQVSFDQEYNVVLKTQTENVSEEFDLALTTQQFTNLDISNYVIKDSYYPSGENAIHYTTSERNVSTIAPGQSSVLKVNVNPNFAYYDYMTLDYSGAGVPNALRLSYLKAVKAKNEVDIEYIRDLDTPVETDISHMRVTPTADTKNKQNGNLYFRISADEAIEKNEDIVITIKFFTNSKAEPIGSVNYYLTVSYLQNAQVTVNGLTDTFIAKGETAKVQIVIDANEQVDLSNVTIENAEEGITRSNAVLVENQDKLRKYYEFYLKADVNAKTKDDSPLEVIVKVTKKESNVTQVKEAKAIVRVVDLRIDKDNINIFGSEDDNFTTHVGLEEAFVLNYNFMPDVYSYDTSDSESINAVKDLEEKRDELASKGYLNLSNSAYNYTINCDKDGRPIALRDRVEFYNTESGQWNSIYASENQTYMNPYDKVAISGGELSDEYIKPLVFRGLNTTEEAAPIRMRVKTVVNLAGTIYDYIKEFNVNVTEYTDEDAPKVIKTEEDFLAIKEAGEAENYILMNNLVLTNYTPFDTTKIDSFDGNGYSITIESFNVRPQNTTTLNLALFNKVTSNTTLKNIIVNIFEAGQILVDIEEYTSINVAGFAIANSGIITNCGVVTFDNQGSYNSDTKYGIKVTYVKGIGTGTPQYIAPGSKWTSRVAGFVLDNENGASITNSFVGDDSVNIIDTTRDRDGNLVYTREYQNENFNVIAQGDISGFVLNNNGSISASHAKNIGIENQSNLSSLNTAGFALSNTGKIITSYIEGVKLDIDGHDAYTRVDSSIKSKLGIVAGFVYSNTENGVIQDSYSNILISNQEEETSSFLASGFVYINDGLLKNCYSASQIENLKYSQMNFSGVDANGNLMTRDGRYENCYYYNSEFVTNENSDQSTESNYHTGAGQLKNVSIADNFYGFSISNKDNQSIWKMTAEGIKLVETELLTISHRYYNVIEKDETTDIETYNLPYARLYIQGGKINSAYGTVVNPIIIRNAQEFKAVTGTTKSTSIAKYLKNNQISGVYRLVSDIDLHELLGEGEDELLLPSSSKTFTGILYGNGFTISNLEITSGERVFSYGLFSSIEKNSKLEVDIEDEYNNYLHATSLTPMILNLNLTASNVVNNKASVVGALAGYVSDSIITNVSVRFNDGSQVEGLNMVGGLIGFAFKNNEISNISIEGGKIIADKYQPTTLTAESLISFRNTLNNGLRGLISDKNQTQINEIMALVANQSFAGSVIGYADMFRPEQLNGYYSNIDYQTQSGKVKTGDSSQSSSGLGFNITSVRTSGSIFVQAGVAGGLFGLTGSKTHVRDAQLEVSGTSNSNNTYILATSLYAGGIIGQSFGSLSQLVATHTKDIQTSINSNLSEYYAKGNTTVERGALDIFSYRSTSRYSQKYIGGLVGLASSGALFNSYSDINVIGLDAEFAGGLIGGINIDNNNINPYTVNIGGDKNISTRYLLNEVYSSGDVRAKARINTSDRYSAGGLVGIIETPSEVMFYVTNSVNYFSLYNYHEGRAYSDIELGIYGTENANSGNLSSEKINVFSFIGAYGNGAQEGKNYYSFNIMTELSFTDNGQQDAVHRETIGAFQYYMRGKNKIYANMTPDKALSDWLNSKVEGDKSPVFEIQSPYTYTDIKVGRNYTQSAFLKSNVWDNDNWLHDLDSLYPTIRYADLKNNTLYLDTFNIDSILKIMKNNPDVHVTVRGAVNEQSPDSTDVRDVDLRGKELDISNFAGTLTGIENSKISLILDKPMFENLGAGANITNLNIKFAPSKNETNTLFAANNGFNGAFVNGQAIENNFSNLKIHITGALQLGNNGSGQTGNNFGILASTMQNTNVEGITISSDVSTTLLTINGQGVGGTTNNSENRDSDNETSMNVGLIAGHAEQTSTIHKTNVSNINFDFKEGTTIFNIANNPNECGKLNAGAYFGLVESRGDSTSNTAPQAFRVMLNDTGNYKMAVSGGFENIVLGGMIGTFNGSEVISNIGTNTKNNIEISNNTSSNICIGGLIGTIGVDGENNHVSNVSLMSSQSGALVKNNLHIAEVDGANMKNLYFGGLVGESKNSVSVIDIKAYNTMTKGSEVYSSEREKGVLNLDNLKVNPTFLSDTDKIIVSESVYYGGLIGKTLSANISKILTDFTRPESQDNINLHVFATKNAYVGGLVGQSENNISISGNFNVTDSYYVETLKSSRATTTQEDVMYIGGLVGKSKTASVEGVDNIGNLIKYTGHIFSNTTTAYLGGIIGYSDTNINIQKTAFGGTIRVLNGKTYIGGTIGYINCVDTKLIIQDNYNYGDVYVADNITAAITFGGVFGLLNSPDNISTDSPNNSTITNNYSLVTFNSKQVVQDDGDINAMFGTKANASELINKANNYYNHGVALCSDDFATDVGYASAYIGYYSKGYKDISEESVSEYKMIEKIKSAVGGTFDTGHKLSPEYINTSSQFEYKKDDNEENKTLKLNDKIIKYPENGVFYAVFSSDLSLANSSLSQIELKNIAIIGDSHSVTAENLESSFIEKISGYSYVSSLNLAVNMTAVVNEEVNQNVGGLVGTVSGGHIYAVGISGNIEVENVTGENITSNVAGLVANFDGNATVRNSYSVANILYRAGGQTQDSTTKAWEGDKGTASAFVGTKTSGNVDIYNSFAGGRVTSYIDANLSAFSQGAFNIKNSYTYTSLDWNDHTTADKDISHADKNSLTVFGSAKLKNSCYDNSAVEGVNVGNGKAFSEISKVISNNGWKQENNLFNYGYPVRYMFKYLAPSSLYSRVEDETNSDKTRGVTEYIYTQLSVEDTYKVKDNNQSDYSYGIPNASVFNKMIGTSGAKYSNYVLLNDIDYLRTALNKGTTLSLGANELDGNGKTIHNFQTTLFKSLKGNDENNKKIIRNLRVTNDNNDGDLQGPSLATSITGNVTLSNMTFSGFRNNVTNGGGGGGIVNMVSGSGNTMSAITNMIHVKGATEYIGGFIGYATGSVTLSYCANYGNIDNEGTNDGNIAGGLIGYVPSQNTSDIIITNSYNAGSVISGYTTNESKYYYSGGLVGRSEGGLSIRDSYNSGIVKAGNKSVGNGKVSYAGGIIGKGVSGSIENCFNEGSIEALGVNPGVEVTSEAVTGASYNYTFIGKKTTHMKVGKHDVHLKSDNLIQYFKVTFSLIGTKNVQAFGIGYVGSIECSNNDSVAKVNNNGFMFNEPQDLGTYELGNFNGNVLALQQDDTDNRSPKDNDDTLRVTNYKIRLSDKFSKEDAYTGINDYAATANGSGDGHDHTNKNFDIMFLPNMGRVYFENDKVNSKYDITFDPAKDINQMAVDKYGIGVNYLFKLPYQYYVNFAAECGGYTFGIAGLAFRQELLYLNMKDKPKYTSLIEQMEKGYLTEKTLDSKLNKDTIYNKKSNTRNTKTADDSKMKSIAGKNYYLVNEDNSSRVFSAGTNIYTVDLKCFDYGVYDKKFYSIENAMFCGEEVDCHVLDIIPPSKEDKDTTIKIIFSILADLSKAINNSENNFTCKIKFKYQNEIEFDASGFKYVSKEFTFKASDTNKENVKKLFGYNIGNIDFYNYDPLRIEGYNVVRISHDSELNPDMLPEDGDNYLYMIYDNGVLYYLPNAILTGSSDGENILVNKKSCESIGEFIDIIGTKNGNNTFYRILDSSEKVEVKVPIISSASSNATIDGFGKGNKDGELSLGTLLNNQLDKFNKNESILNRDIVYEFGLRDDLSVAEGSVLTLIDSTNSNNQIATFTFSDGKWSIVLAENNEFNIDDLKVTAKVSEADSSKLQLIFNEVSSDVESLDTYLQKLKFTNGTLEESFDTYVDSEKVSLDQTNFNLEYNITLKDESQTLLMFEEEINPNEDISNALLGFKSGDKTWVFDENIIETFLSLEGANVTVSSEGNVLKISYSNLTTSEEVQSKINNLLNSYILVEDTTKSSVELELESLNSILGNNGNGLTWSSLNDKYVYEYDENNFILDEATKTISLKNKNSNINFEGITLSYYSYIYNVGYQISRDIEVKYLNNSGYNAYLELSTSDTINQGAIENGKELSSILNNITSSINVSGYRYAGLDLTGVEIGNAGIELNMVLENAGKTYLIEGYLKNSNIGYTLSKYLNTYEINEKEDPYYIDKVFILNEEVENKEVFVFYDGIGRRIAKYDVNTGYWYGYYDENGAFGENSENIVEDCYIINDEKVYFSTSRNNFLESNRIKVFPVYIDLQELELLKTIYQNEDLLKIATLNDKSMVYLDKGFEIKENVNSLSTNIKQYEYYKTKSPDSLEFDKYVKNSQVLPNIKESDTSQLEFYVNDKLINEYNGQFTLDDINGNRNFIINFKDSDQNKYKVKISLSAESEYNTNLRLQTTKDPLPIILMKDISLGNIDTDILKKGSSLSISGNNYFINFYRETTKDGLFQSSQNSDGYIKNLVMLGELKNGSYLNGANIYDNVSLYGNVRENGITENLNTTYPALILNSISYKVNVTSHFSIQDKNSTEGTGSNITLFANKSAMFAYENYGFIFAGDGADGASREKCTPDSDSKQGDAGSKGGDIIVYTGASDYKNNGLIVSGNGGNGGSGSTGISKSGQGGSAGNGGGIIGFVSNEFSKAGKAGVVGSKGGQENSNVGSIKLDETKKHKEFITITKYDGTGITVTGFVYKGDEGIPRLYGNWGESRWDKPNKIVDEYTRLGFNQGKFEEIYGNGSLTKLPSEIK